MQIYTALPKITFKQAVATVMTGGVTQYRCWFLDFTR